MLIIRYVFVFVFTLEIICMNRDSLTFHFYINKTNQLRLFIFFSYMCKYFQLRLVAQGPFNPIKLTLCITEGINCAKIPSYYFTLQGLYIIPFISKSFKKNLIVMTPLTPHTAKQICSKKKMSACLLHHHPLPLQGGNSPTLVF